MVRLEVAVILTLRLHFKDDMISRNTNIASLTSVGAMSTASASKPSFLLWDKVYQKITDPDDELWLLRACGAVMSYFKDVLDEHPPLRSVGLFFPFPPWVRSLRSRCRTQLGLVLLHLATAGSSPSTRGAVQATIRDLASTSHLSGLVTLVVRDAMDAFLAHTPSMQSESDHHDLQVQASLKGVLRSSVLFGDDNEDTWELLKREEMVVNLIVIGHHPRVCRCLCCFQFDSQSHLILLC